MGLLSFFRLAQQRDNNIKDVETVLSSFVAETKNFQLSKDKKAHSFTLINSEKEFLHGDQDIMISVGASSIAVRFAHAETWGHQEQVVFGQSKFLNSSADMTAEEIKTYIQNKLRDDLQNEIATNAEYRTATYSHNYRAFHWGAEPPQAAPSAA